MVSFLRSPTTHLGATVGHATLSLLFSALKSFIQDLSVFVCEIDNMIYDRSPLQVFFRRLYDNVKSGRIVSHQTTNRVISFAVRQIGARHYQQINIRILFSRALCMRAEKNNLLGSKFLPYPPAKFLYFSHRHHYEILPAKSKTLFACVRSIAAIALAGQQVNAA